MEEFYLTDKGREYLERLQRKGYRNPELGLDLTTLVLIDSGDSDTIYETVDKYPKVKQSLKLLVKDGYVDLH